MFSPPFLSWMITILLNIYMTRAWNISLIIPSNVPMGRTFFQFYRWEKDTHTLRGVNGLFTSVVLWFVAVLGLNPSWITSGVKTWGIGNHIDQERLSRVSKATEGGRELLELYERICSLFWCWHVPLTSNFLNLNLSLYICKVVIVSSCLCED